MSFLSVLGKIGKGALGLVPGGGTLSTVLDAAGSVGSVLGKQQQGKAQGQVTQAQLQQAQDRAALERYQAQQQAQFQAGTQDLQRQQFAQNNRSTTAKQALIGALLGGGVIPTSISSNGASGGLLRSLNANPDALAALKMLGQQGSQAQNMPLSFQGGNILPAPTLTALPKVDRGGVLSTLATLGQLAGAASPYLKGIGKKSPIDEQPISAGDFGGYG